MFASLIIRLFQLVFSAEIVFSLTTNQPEQCFGLFFQRSERGHKVLKIALRTMLYIPSILVTDSMFHSYIHYNSIFPWLNFPDVYLYRQTTQIN